MTEQNFANHTKFVPVFHFFVLPVLIINVGRAVYRLIALGFSLDGFFSLLTAIAILLGILFARMFAMKVQDRVIRDEELLRYERLLPADLQSRVPEFTLSQVVALRFASDAELPTLARKVLDEKLSERSAIKKLVKTWKPDYCRA